MIDEGILKGSKAADLGCGIGNAAIFLYEHGFEVDAVDKKTQTIPGVNFVQADIRHFFIQENSYDIIHARNVLQFLGIDEIPPMIAKMNKGLKPGGVLYFSLLGTKDGWNGIKSLTFVSEAEADELASQLNIHGKTFYTGKGTTTNGIKKTCQVFYYTCIR